MCSSISRLTEETRKLILDKWCREKGISYRMIAKHCGVSHQAVSSTINRFGDHHTIKELPGRGRKVGSYDKKVDKKVTTMFDKKNHCHSVKSQ